MNNEIKLLTYPIRTLQQTEKSGMQ